MMAYILRHIRNQKFVYLFTRNFELSRRTIPHNVGRAFSISFPSQNLELARKFGNAYTNMDKSSFLKIHQFEKLLNLVKKCNYISTTQASFLLRCCGQVLIFEDDECRKKITAEVWNVLTKLKVSLNVSHLNSLLKAHIDNGEKVKYDEIFELMKSQNIEPNRATYRLLVNYFCQQGSIEEASKILKILKEGNYLVDVDIFNSLIIGSGRSNDLAGALKVIEIMKENNIEIESSTYDSVMKVYSEMNKFEEVKAIIEEAKNKCITTNPQTLLELFHQFKIHNNHEALDWILPKITPDQPINVVGIYIQKLIKSKEYKCANKIVDLTGVPHIFHINMMMKHAPIEMTLNHCVFLYDSGQSPRIFSYLMKIYENSNDLVSLLRTFKMMEEKGIDILMYHIANAVDTFVKPDDPVMFRNLIDILQYDNGKYHRLYVDHVFPLLDMSHPMKTLTSFYPYFRTSDIRHLECFEYILKQNNVKAALNFLKETGGFRKCYLVTVATISDAFCENLSLIEEFAQIAVFIHKFSLVLESLGDYKNFFEQLIYTIKCDLAKYNCENKENIMYEFLKAMEKYGLSISEKYCNNLLTSKHLSKEAEELVRKMVGATKTEQYYDMVNYGSSRNIPKPGKILHQENTDDGYLEDYNITPHCVDTSYAEFDKCFRNNCFDKAESMFRHYNNPPLWALSKMTFMYMEKRMFKECADMLNKIYSDHRYIIFDNYVNMAYLESLLALGKISHAMSHLTGCIEIESNIYDIPESFQSLIATSEQTEEICRFKDMLIAKNYWKLSFENKTTFDIIDHIESNNLEEAFDKIKKCNNNKVLCKQRFLSKCIEMEAANIMSKFHRYVIAMEGPTAANYSLVMASLRLKKFNQAEKVIKGVWSKLRIENFDDFINKCISENDFDTLERFLKTTTDANMKSRLKYYTKLVYVYIKNRSAERALNLWVIMQEQNIDLDKLCLYKLANLLRESGHKVPFIAPTFNLFEMATNNILIIDLYNEGKSGVIKLHSSNPMKADSLIIESLCHNTLTPSQTSVLLSNILNFENIFDFYYKMKTAGIHINKHRYIKLLYRICQRNEQHEIFLLESMKMELNGNVLLNFFIECFHDSPQCIAKVNDICDKLSHHEASFLKSAIWNYYMCYNQEKEADMFFDNYLKGGKHLIISNRLIQLACLEGTAYNLRKYVVALDNKYCEKILINFHYSIWKKMYDMGHYKHALCYLNSTLNDVPFNKYKKEAQYIIKKLYAKMK